MSRQPSCVFTGRVCFAALVCGLLLLQLPGFVAVQPEPEPPDLPVGSLDNATVALPMPDGPQPVTFLTSSMRPEDVAAVTRAHPNLTILTGLSVEDAIARAGNVDGADWRYCTPEFLKAATNLRWVQAASAGVERYLSIPELRDNDQIVFTNMQGVHGPTIADHVLAMLLHLTRDLGFYADPANRGTWNRGGSGVDRIALDGRTMFVVGLGGIGTEVARRAKGFGMHVIATRRSATPPPPFVDEQGTPDDLERFLKRADVVVLCVPLTTETEGMIDADALAMMPRGSYLINIARGKVVDTDALVEALQSGHLAGAGLDVTDPEPLPSDHVLWSVPNVIITPHVAGRSELTGERRTMLLLENLKRFATGAPLLNVVDKKAGY